MLWILLFAGVLAFAWFLFGPPRLRTLENVPAVIDEELHAHDLTETVEDPAEIRPMAERAAKRAGDIPAPGHGDSLTFDWPSDPAEPHHTGERPSEGPINPQ